MENTTIYDIIGIGIGPFNLGLAALTNSIEALNCAFFDKQKHFNWHPGIMLDNTRMQVPYYADLVTLADPCSKFNYMNFLKSKNRLLQFGVLENTYPTRKEYNAYCQWVAGQLSNLHFGMQCEAIHYDHTKELFTVFLRETVSQLTFTCYAKHIIIGIGSTPALPSFAEEVSHPLVFHSGDYLNHKQQLVDVANITLVGAGQSAAEIFRDMLHDANLSRKELYWFTRSPRFLPMDYSKLTLEMTSPGYINHFFHLKPARKKQILQGQDTLYKGINTALLEEIYDCLYAKSIDSSTENIHLHTNCEAQHLLLENNNIVLKCFHGDVQQSFIHKTNAVIFATGYKPAVPSFVEPVKELISWREDGLYNVQRNYAVDVAGSKIFVQNAELHTHGFNAADLGMGPYRNAVIINAVVGYEHYSVESHAYFQTFGLPVETGSHTT